MQNKKKLLRTICPVLQHVYVGNEWSNSLNVVRRKKKDKNKGVASAEPLHFYNELLWYKKEWIFIQTNILEWGITILYPQCDKWLVQMCCLADHSRPFAAPTRHFTHVFMPRRQSLKVKTWLLVAHQSIRGGFSIFAPGHIQKQNIKNTKDTLINGGGH